MQPQVRAVPGVLSLLPMRRSSVSLAVLAISVAIIGCEQLTASTTPSGSQPQVRVTRVVDGDTIAVRLDGRTEKVRYIGMDTPETVKPNSPVECFGKAASEENKRLVDGRKVTLQFDVERRDRYDRLLAYVRLADGTMVNETLLRRGYATTLTIPPNVRYASRFRKAQREAREAGRGLWRACST